MSDNLLNLVHDQPTTPRFNSFEIDNNELPKNQLDTEATQKFSALDPHTEIVASKPKLPQVVPKLEMSSKDSLDKSSLDQIQEDLIH